MKRYEDNDVLQLPPARPLRPDELLSALMHVVEHFPPDEVAEMVDMIAPNQ